MAKKKNTTRVWMINVTLIDGESYRRANVALHEILNMSDETVAEHAMSLGFPEFEAIEVACHT